MEPLLGVALLDWLYNALGSVMAFFYAIIPSYAFSIIMLTIAVRVLLIPLTNKQVKSQRAMQLLQPELKKLQAKYKGDRQKLNEEMMKLYKEHKANPLAGCLPLLLQMPLFIVLYRLIMSLAKVPPRHIPLGSKLHDALIESSGKLQSIGMDLAKKPQTVIGLLLVAAVVATGYYQQKQMTARMPAGLHQSADGDGHEGLPCLLRVDLVVGSRRGRHLLRGVEPVADRTAGGRLPQPAGGRGQVRDRR